MPAALGARKETPPRAVWWELSDAASESGVVRAAPPEVRRSLWADINAANVSAGVTAGLWYAFGAIPLQMSAAEKLHPSPAVASSRFFVIWLTGAMASIPLTLRYRQPLAITWTIPGLVFLVSTGGRFTPGELARASLVAGVLIVALGLLGVGARLMR